MNEESNGKCLRHACDTDIASQPSHGGDRNTFEVMTST